RGAIEEQLSSRRQHLKRSMLPLNQTGLIPLYFSCRRQRSEAPPIAGLRRTNSALSRSQFVRVVESQKSKSPRGTDPMGFLSWP
nr:hypothetical protein [Tanacetum cinerariifolium]